MVLNKILDYYHAKGINEAVVAKDVYLAKDLIGSLNSLFVVKVFNDVRSATFFAMGRCQSIQKPVLLIVDSDYIANCYTGIVEAWFQNTPIIVLALGNEQGDSTYLNRYLKKRIALQIDGFIDDTIFDDTIHVNGPTVITVPEQVPSLLIETNENDYKIKAFVKLLNNNSMVFCAQSFKDYFEGFNRLKVVLNRNRYCSISEYLGYINGTGSKAVIVIPFDWVTTDLNIFNSRYINSNFKVVLVKGKQDHSIDITNWLKNHDIKVLNESTDDDSLQRFLTSEEPLVLIIN